MRQWFVLIFLCSLAVPVAAQADFECQGPPCTYTFPAPQGTSGDCEGVSWNGVVGGDLLIPATVDTLYPSTGAQNLYIEGAGVVPGAGMNLPDGTPPTTLPASVPQVFVPVPAGATGISFTWNTFFADGFQGAGPTWNDGVMIDLIDGSDTQLAVLAFADASGTGTGSPASASNCTGLFGFGPTGEELAPSGAKVVTALAIPTGGVYLRISAWNGFDTLGAPSIVVDDINFGIDFTITCVNNPNMVDSDVAYHIAGGAPGSLVYLAQTVNAGVAPNGLFFGIEISLAEIQLQAAFGNPFINLLDMNGEFDFNFPLFGIVCPLGVALDVVPIEFAPGTTFISAVGRAKTVVL